MSNFSYYKLQTKFITACLGTTPSASIHDEHVLQKTKKNIEAANRLGIKVTKALAKFQGEFVDPKKELSEIHGILRQYMVQIGESFELPETYTETLTLAKELEEKYSDVLLTGDANRATIFMRDKNGYPIISSHIVKGYIKHVCAVITNGKGEDCRDVFKSKVQAQECLSLDIKCVEEYMIPDHDVIKDESGKSVILERPIRFVDRLTGQQTTAIARSEQLPVDTILSATLRIRKGSPIDSLEVLEKFFDFGKNSGFGAHRSSGNQGGFIFKLEALPDYKEVWADGWK